MKRHGWYCLPATMLALVLAACGGGGGASAPGTNNQPPIVATTASSSVTVNSATANGSVNPNGSATNAWIEWGTDSSLAAHTDTATQSVGSGVASVSVNTALAGLSAGTTYYYRVCGGNSVGESRGAIVDLTTGTPAAPPTVQTNAATGIIQTGATLNGQINPNSVATDGRFRWGYGSATLTNLTAWVALGAGATSVSISFNVTGQSPGTPIYFQAEGDSSAGNTLGTVANFTTSLPDLPPTVTTLGATNISQTVGTLNGQVNPNGVASNGRFRWGYTATTLTNLTSWLALGSGTTDIAISHNLIGQSPGTPIYYQAEGDSSAGNTLGAVANFTTSLIVSAPTATTGASSNITVNSADVGATVNPNNDPTSACIEWGTASDLSTYSSTSTQSIGTDGTNHTMSAGLGGLTDNTTIYYRVRAWNTVGTVRGQISSFATLVADTVTINVETYSGDAFIIFRNDAEVHRSDNGGVFTYTGTSGDYKFISVPGALTTAGKPKTVVDETNDYNVFRLAPGANITLIGAHLSRTGRVTYITSGSGYTTVYQAPGNVSGIWHIRSVVDNSTNGNVPVGAVGTWDINCTLNEFQILWADPDLGTIYGTANGDLVYNWLWGGSDPLWRITWRETLIVNSAGTTLTGDNFETWTARSGTDYFYVHGNSTGTR